MDGSCLVSGETLAPRRLASDVSPEAKGGGGGPGICSCLMYCEVAVYSRDPERFLVSWPCFLPQCHARSWTGGPGDLGAAALEWPPSNVCPLRAQQPLCEDSWAILAMGSGGQCVVAATRRAPGVRHAGGEQDSGRWGTCGGQSCELVTVAAGAPQPVPWIFISRRPLVFVEIRAAWPEGGWAWALRPEHGI